MIIIPPDKSQEIEDARDEGPLQSLPGPPPSAPAKSPPRRRKRRLRFILSLLAFCIFAIAVHSARRGGPHARPWTRPPHGRVFMAQPPPHKFKHATFSSARLPQVEKTFLSVPSNDSALAASKIYAGKPHLAGSEQDLVTARLFLGLFQTHLGIAKPEDEPLFDAGSRQSQRAIHGTTTIPRRINRPIAWIDTYYPILNTGVEQKLEILEEDGSVYWVADLKEDGDEKDPASKYKDAIPTWHGLSKGGDVSGPLVQVGYGRKEEFDALVASGADLTGTIALVRYGINFRGLKVKAAQEAGCVGVLIYSDPHDDGVVTEDNGYEHWPHGPARNPTSVQRGSVQFLSKYPGDPYTPGYPAYKNASRIEDPTSIPSIPSIPISWNNAKRLLNDSLKNSRKVHLVNKVDDKITPIYNTMALIPGLITEQAVVVGNHRDAWVMGAGDPVSGSVSLHELVRGLGALLQTGWKPLRTIILASWDAEEYGLVGSTEWGEDFEDWIQAHVVAYLNLDISVSGSRYSLKGSPSLAHLIMEAAQAVDHPTKVNKTLWDARLERGSFIGEEWEDRHDDSEVIRQRMEEETFAEQEKIPVTPLGSGSDYTVMLQRLGVASTDMGYASTLSDPVYHYHSIYDSQAFQEKYADPTFQKHVAVSKHLGLMMLRLADSTILPINTTHYALELFKYLDGVDRLAERHTVNVDTSSLRSALHELLRTSLKLDSTRTELLAELERAAHDEENVASTMFSHVKDWFSERLGLRDEERPWRGHHFERNVFFELHDMQAYVLAPEHAPAVDLYQPPMDMNDMNPPFPPSFNRDNIPEILVRVRELDIRLGRFERGFLSESGIKDREWYRHLGVAPGKWKGYGATPFPALSEAIEIERNSTLAQAEVGRLVEVVDNLISMLTLSESK